jgi:hypothetical protein
MLRDGELVNIFVASPSFASTDAELKETCPVPTALALNVSVTILPLVPAYPGLGTIPSNEAVPSAFEKLGSDAQIVTMLPDFDTESSCKVSLVKVSWDETAFIA